MAERPIATASNTVKNVGSNPTRVTVLKYLNNYGSTGY